MNMQKMMKEMQKMQSKMTTMQSALEEKSFEAEAGGGLVKMTMNGKYELMGITLKKEAVDPDDVEALEDLIMAAYGNVKSQIDAETQNMMGGLKSGLKLPGM